MAYVHASSTLASCGRVLRPRVSWASYLRKRWSSEAILANVQFRDSISVAGSSNNLSGYALVVPLVNEWDVPTL